MRPPWPANCMAFGEEEVLLRRIKPFRLGVVLSFAWALGAAHYENGKVIAGARDIWETEFEACVATHVANPSAPYEAGDCVKSAQSAYSTFTELRTPQVAIVALLPIPFAWAFVYLLIRIFRWVAPAIPPKS